ncbi:serine hydrolase [Enterococcus cecorum]|uniref:serine hydrolase n=1 Tax=Enterococcus cecorum TaxID=44008 RepID=UPI0022D9CBC1|nr:serine hydrolase [Enterococcus cecorum]CAI3255217.1 D-alanyl-D-alanine carboxypeptidase [Enterococcus cecorum]CAI3256338.1 D-alanyl-D-alanine carboxypeptidase [Enterococcus cecorum]CAI3256577.1 D-alanyl-D-alanine carboxypeptidase [Enterococcus cecorum]CAI3256613.1 D-alanyl-D-alanine carboxypeptidase [Enterococcus cecorum]CAI3256941.1 D-alanyl-D-alanine carboxypeptidase [Enterococcus cecorum]
MRKAVNPLYFIAMTLLFCFFSTAPLWADETQNNFSIDAKAAIAVDADSGKIFYAQDSTTPMPIASITKVLSIYVVYDKIKNEELDLLDQVVISPQLAELSTKPELSNVALVANQAYTVESLIHASLIQSANAAVMALGEKVAGSQEQFVNLMRQKAESLGITDAKIISVSGLNNRDLGDFRYPGTGDDEENEMSAQDVAIIAKHFIADYPEVLNITSTVQESFGENTAQPSIMQNWNQLLPGLPLQKEGVIGLKTGTTDLAGACFVGVIRQNSREVITVVLHANNQANDSNARFVETSKLMDYALNQWQEITLSATDLTNAIRSKLAVIDGKQASVSLKVNDPYKLWVPVQFDSTQLKYEEQLEVQSIQAPVQMNREVGTLTINNPTDNYGYLPDSQTPESQIKIVTANAVKKENFFVLWLRQVKNIAQNAWMHTKQFFQSLF